MNFLAHLYLSGNDPEIMVGNFLGDFVRGRNLLERYKKNIAMGIELHRTIDEFTDTHPVVAQSKDRLRGKYRHYSAVIVDIFYDHFLAKNWHEYTSELLPDFADHAYKVLQQHLEIFPQDAQYMLPYMVNGNWLVNYAKQEGIQRALSGMARRTKFNSRMDESVQEMVLYYEEFYGEFKIFFPQLKKITDEFIRRQT
jgi:acyl carrier protein phosphodiesterase